MEIESLDLSHSHMIDIPLLFSKKIRHLNLSHNRVRVLWSQNMPRDVESVNLEANELYSDGLLEDWPETIHTLNLSRNPFCRLSETMRWPLNLRSLNLSGVPVQSIPFLPEGLEELDISFTDIEHLLTLPKTLLVLKANNSILRSVPRIMPVGIREVNLARCKLKNAAALPSFWGLALESLCLSRNKIDMWPKALPHTIRHLNLSNNRIQQIPDTNPFSFLKTLNLSNNRIQQIPSWISSAAASSRTTLIFLSGNCLIHVDSYWLTGGILSIDDQWNTVAHQASAKIIQRFWKRSKVFLRLRYLRRMNLLRIDLLTETMHPDRAGKFDELSERWKKIRRTTV
jgi:Leucine-rich repeat (LRR) protein